MGVTISPTYSHNMLLHPLLLLSPLVLVSGERIQSIATHTKSCLSCGMIEGTSYLTVQVCGSQDCCLSRSLESANYEIGAAPFSITAFHDGPDGLTLSWIEVRTEMRSARCELNDAKLDDHSFVKASCY